MLQKVAQFRETRVYIRPEHLYLKMCQSKFFADARYDHHDQYRQIVEMYYEKWIHVQGSHDIDATKTCRDRQAIPLASIYSNARRERNTKGYVIRSQMVEKLLIPFTRSSQASPFELHKSRDTTELPKLFESNWKSSLISAMNIE